MRLTLALLLFIGIVYGNSTSYYGWQPSKELLFRFESKVENSIPEIREQQKSGIRLISTVRIQTFPDYSLRIKFENPKFMTFNGVEPQPREEPVPPQMLQHLEQPFKVQLKRGVIEAMYVHPTEPITVTNMKKALLANLNLDITASRRSSIQSNVIQVQETSPVDQSYFVVREQSLHGDCQTSYTIHPLPLAEALEIEQKLEREEKEKNTKEHLPGGRSQGKEVCRGKNYYQITKTRNFDNCIETPVYQKWLGLRSKCDTTMSYCPELMNHISATNYIVCGQSIEEFVIRKAVTENTILANLAWNVKEKLLNSARVTLELLREQPIHTPMQPIPNPKKIRSLIFEYPEQSFESTRSLNQELPEAEKNKIERLTGIKPVLPMPDLRSAPKLLIPSNLDKNEIAHQVLMEMEKVAREIFESPESCSSKGDVAGHLSVIAKVLGTLSYNDLEYVYNKVESQLALISPSAHESVKALFIDVLAMTGSNPAVMLVKEKLRNPIHQRLAQRMAVNVLQIVFKSIKTPTKELLNEMVSLVQNDLKHLHHQYPSLYTAGLAQMSNLLYRACVSPNSRLTEYPTKLYGPFCSKESEIITQKWIPFLTQELEQQQDRLVKLAALTSLGKMGHLQAIKPLTKIISDKQYDPLIRTLATYSLKRVARVEPVHVKHILLSIIDNLAERTEVRIAAISILPFAQPSTAELQKIAARTWLEPSKEVASFVYSTYHSLKDTQVPELKLIGLKIRPILHLIKPLMYGIHYSQSHHTSKFVEYLDLVISQKFSWVQRKENQLPSYGSISNRFFGGSYEINTLSLTGFTEGIDKWLEQALYNTGYITKPSPQVKDQLSKITSELNIEGQKAYMPEVFGQLRFLDAEYFTYINEAKLTESMEKVATELRNNPRYFEEEKKFEYSSVSKAIEAEGVGPTDAGFLIYTERNIPLVYAMKASSQMESSSEPTSKVPKSATIKIMPVLNVKVEAYMGVISPFTKEFVGSGMDMALHYTLPLEGHVYRQGSQITVNIKTPDQVNSEIEAIHVYIKPITVIKPLRNIVPFSKSPSVVPILSGEPVKKIDMNIGHSLDLELRLIGESDNKYSDLYSYWEKIKQHNALSIVSSFYLPSTIRMSSAKIVYNPQQSQTKEISVSFSLLKVSKESPSSSLKFNVPGAESETITDMNLIKQVCKEIYPKDTLKYGQCIMQLSALEVVTDASVQVCKIHPFPNCHKYVQICEEAKKICETKHGYLSSLCQTKKHACLNRILNLKLVNKTMEEMGNSGSVYAMRLDASIKSAPSSRSQKSIHTAFAFGTKRSYIDNSIQVISNVEVQPTSSSPVYMVKVGSKLQLPRVTVRWNKESLLQEALTFILNAKLEYGYEGSNRMEEVVLKSKMFKTKEQIEAVRQSPEYRKCVDEENKGHRLSPICEYARHQAASVDKMVADLTLPVEIAESPYYNQLGLIVRAFFIGQVYEYEDPSFPKPEHLQLIANVSRLGEDTQLEVKAGGYKYVLPNVRLNPTLFKNIVPVSVRNPLVYNIMQKMTDYQMPSSCRIEPRYIATFDNKTYNYEIDSCWHLLLKDRSNVLPVAVLARSPKNIPEQKEVKILSGKTIVQLTPSGQDLNVKAEVEGRVQSIHIKPGSVEKIEYNGKVMVIVERFHDNVYLFDFPQEFLWVFTDGQRIEVSASQMLRSKLAGLCGDMNGEHTLDLMTPRKCQMSRPRLAAYSYMLREPTCPGVPANDRAIFERELSQCVREEYFPTPVNRLADVVEPKIVKPLVSVHIVEKNLLASKVCISKEKLRICPKSSSVSSQTIRKRVQFVCFYSHSLKAQQLEQLAKSGETLYDDLNNLPTAFIKTEYEPTSCPTN